jgi:hypothetical protein
MYKHNLKGSLAPTAAATVLTVFTLFGIIKKMPPAAAVMHDIPPTHNAPEVVSGVQHQPLPERPTASPAPSASPTVQNQPLFQLSAARQAPKTVASVQYKSLFEMPTASPALSAAPRAQNQPLFEMPEERRAQEAAADSYHGLLAESFSGACKGVQFKKDSTGYAVVIPKKGLPRGCAVVR